MPRWKAAVLQHARWSSSVAQGAVLCVLTFGLVLPLCCHRCLYSYYFIRSVYLDWMSDVALQESYERGQQALRYWQNLAAAESPASPLSKRPELLVTVVTAQRTDGRDFHYLLQVMHRLDALLRTCGDAEPCAEVLVCDVESSPSGTEDASLLEKRFRVVRRSLEEKKVSEYLNVFEKEKRDYVYCLRKGWELLNPRNVVVLEDDALPRMDFFAVIRDLRTRRFAQNSLYVKLYHPERLQRYWNPEPYRILEWVGLGLVGATALLLFCVALCGPRAPSLSPVVLLFLVLYVMAVVELGGRHYFLELRRISPQLYAVSPATECCTPAMLYPGNASARVAALLERVKCIKGHAKDMALYQLARNTPGERAHSVEPNLITHIGAFSSVRPNHAHPKLL
ncbi:transmembrane protein 246 [Colossoma macropomum]|uniref:transmembrane protein 246 n=1 Tax=Colossoma macropomum TaxID=42526 RepID=UPI001863CBE6|nr:transmembrane protein 246 [Colossoma macropomum]XP_036420224.1 transmembrane protein 246 [Colossoma macropomum]XP_036420226.1 transmembrane protein 246 [Colossoma macropomum]XP_036420227.1 transmembrane protein 246 [Colossoma macropomum]XP_036420228.1 transmembrane protein 246 [Colossoma macropomum]